MTVDDTLDCEDRRLGGCAGVIVGLLLMVALAAVTLGVWTLLR